MYQIIDIKEFQIHIKTTDEGVVVDIFDRKALQKGDADPLASTYAFDHEIIE
jgi:hypothetical protein